ncbi:MAG TPA: cell division protein FtsI [Lachnospiraceae bacterium]|nr:cell division protein FtsI [Lachnospiraceae bacterium]
MAQRKAKVKKERRFNKMMQKKLLASFAFVLLLLAGLLIRIATISATRGNRYAKKVLSQQSYDSRSIPARRGVIQDRNSIILARSDRYYNVVLDCAAINEKEDYLEPTIAALEQIIGVDRAMVRDVIVSEKTRDSRYQVIERNITSEVKKEFDRYRQGKDLDEDAMGRDAYYDALNERANVQGVWFEERYIRTYPYNSLASKVVGFSNAVDVGTTGVENYYNDMLNGTNGREFGYLNDDSEFERTTIEPEHGKTLRLTIDMNIQEILQEKIDAFDRTYGDEAHNGKGAKNVGVIAMDPNTGEILGMATNREYDLNNPTDLTTEGFSGAEIKSMDDDTYVEELNTKWKNFCVSEGFEPGSVFKPITVASALETGSVHDGDGFVCNGSLFITDTTIKCDNVYGHGDETLEYAIVNSCNVALMTIGMQMGITNFINYQQAFGFGSPTGIDLPNENAGVVYNRETMHEVELATCTFGQGFTINMVQEAAAFSAVVNGGYYYQPHVVGQILSADGTSVETVEPILLRQPVSTSVSKLVRGYLKTAVREGTGRKSQVPGYQTGGKTGTAEKIDPADGTRWKGHYVVSFIGAAPIDDPKVVLYVVIDEPNVAEQADSSYPQVLFRQIATDLFPYLGIYPTEVITDDLLQFLGITMDETVENKVKSATFQCFDSSGNLYNDAAVNEDGEVIDSRGNVIPGCVADLDKGIVTDGYGNQIPVDVSAIVADREQVADNPDIAAPPDKVEGDGQDDTTWTGATVEDKEEEE